MRSSVRMFWWTIASTTLTRTLSAQIHLRVNNANRIFNAVHSSMRQWGSSVNHNGMTAFLATVPAGTLLYHGAPSTDPVTGLEWLAFEVEHSLQFARFVLIPGPLPPEFYPDDDEVVQDAQHPIGMTRFQGDADKAPLLPPPIFWDIPGVLNTYEAKHDLRLLYLDGSAAAKSERGTLDLSDYLILNNDTMRTYAELERARGLCEIAEHEWHSHIEGFIRMECGFEIIMCSFNRSLNLLSQQTPFKVIPSNRTMPPRLTFNWLAAAAKRYDGIGGSPARVILDYENFVSAYTTPMRLFSHESDSLPRVDVNDTMNRDHFRRSVADMVLKDRINGRDSAYQSLDWQAVTDMVVNQFSDQLQYLVSSNDFVSSGIEMAQEMTLMFRGHIDTKDRNPEMEVKRCVQKFVSDPPQLEQNQMELFVAHRAIHEVTTTICSTMHEVLMSLPSPNAGPEDDIDPHDQVEKIKHLMNYLGWSTWKRCRGCKYGEICITPMFPFGTLEDYEHPQCKSVHTLGNITGYWEAGVVLS